MSKEKWSKDQIKTLIEAFKHEQCLYASDLPNYRNKHVRGEALIRVVEKVSRLRPRTTKEECQKKFKNLRNQFNIENVKMKESQKSSTDTKDMYKPNLWYFSQLLFLDTYLTTRKSRSSLKQDVQNTDLQSSSTGMYASENQILSNEDTNSMDRNQQLGLLIPFLPPNFTPPATDAQEDNSPSVQCNTSPDLSTSPNSDDQSNHFKFSKVNKYLNLIPGTNILAPSTPSISGESDKTQQSRSRKRSREDAINEAIKSLAESLRQQIVVTNTQNTQFSKNPTVNGFLMFVGALLESIQDEEMKLEVMSSITDTVINARSLDLRCAKK